MNNPISLNPYRILGLKANATAQEKQAARNTIAAYQKVGSTAVLPFDNITTLEPIQRDQNMVDLASNAILEDNDKIVHSIFWFIAGNLTDELALNNLIEKNDKDKALEVFRSVVQNSESNSNNYGAFINYSTLSLIGNSDVLSMENIKEAIIIKRKISKNNTLIQAIGNKLQLDVKNLNLQYISDEVLDKLIGFIKALYPLKDEFELLNYFFSEDKEVLESGFKKLLNKVNLLINEAAEKRTKYFDVYSHDGVKLIRECTKIGENLLKEAQPILNDIKVFFGVSNMQTQNTYERVFEEINYCVITPYNKFQSIISDQMRNKDIEGVRKIAKEAGSYIFDGPIRLTQKSIDFSKDVSFPMLSTMKSNLDGIKEMRDIWKDKYDLLTSDQPIRGEDRDGCGSELGGCIGEGIVSIVVRLLFLGLIGLLVNNC